jgi:glyoxylase-like metal-dependent hydrolase (beta-lactamase superfamily II)
MHLGNDRVIAAHELPGGLIVDPGPTTCAETLLTGLVEEPRALLLTHIHLDHAGASGVLARRFPELRVYVHEIGAPHLADPAKLLRSAERLYGDDMERLWGEVAPVPSDRITAIEGGERVERLETAYTPGHASHHVAYFDPTEGDAYVGDVAGVRIPPSELTVPPTPPPDIDLEAWEGSLQRIAKWGPARLRITHFGAIEEVDDQLEAIRGVLARSAERSREGQRERFIDSLEQEFRERATPDVAERARQAAPPDQSWQGLERYWRKRREREEAAATS